ncbi:MAG: rRNA adenine N-6-methyltransferase family protein, partial [Candidatus Colwellbacteria bacterium]
MAKRLGQHFLKDKRALQKITVALEISPHDTVVEIGPGHGELTSFLLRANPKKIIAIEKDKGMIQALKENFQLSSLTRYSVSKRIRTNSRVFEII